MTHKITSFTQTDNVIKLEYRISNVKDEGWKSKGLGMKETEKQFLMKMMEKWSDWKWLDENENTSFIHKTAVISIWASSYSYFSWFFEIWRLKTLHVYLPIRSPIQHFWKFEPSIIRSFFSYFNQNWVWCSFQIVVLIRLFLYFDMKKRRDSIEEEIL